MMRTGSFSLVVMAASLAICGAAPVEAASRPEAAAQSDDPDTPHCNVAMAGVNQGAVYLDEQCKELDPYSGPIKPAYVVTTLVASDTTTEVDPANCYVEVDGIVWLNQSCPVDTADAGNWYINTGPQAVQTFVYLQTLEGAIDAHWNGGSGATHAHDPLGTLTRRGDCFTNDRAKICIPHAE
jgi:hypothetical protein